MLGFVKKLFGRKEAAAPAAVPSPQATQPKSAAAGQTSAPVPVAARDGTAGGGSPGRPGPAHEESQSGTITVSLLGIVGLLPTEMKPAKAVGDVAGVQISFPERSILEQLQQGVIRVPFGEVRQLAPRDFFTVGHEHDRKLVDLPLGEVLAQVSSRSFVRRGDQKTTHVPEDVTNVFSARTAGSSGTAHMSKPAAPAEPASAAPRAAAKPATGPASPAKPPAIPSPAPAKPAGPAAKSVPPASVSPGAPYKPGPASPSAPKVASTATPTLPSKPFKPEAPPSVPSPAPAAGPAGDPASSAPSKPISAPGLLAAMGSKPAGGSPPAVKPVAAPVTPAKSPGVPVAAAVPAGKPGLPAAPSKPAAPVSAAPASQPPAITSQTPVLVELGQISAAWPDGIRREIATWQLETAQVGLPSAEVGSALRLGRVQFAWSAILQCLQDGSGAERQAATAFGSEVLDIPLQVIAPLFIASTRGTAPAARKKSFDDSIPDLFQQSPVAGPGASSPAPKNGGATTHIRKPASTAQEPVVGPASGPTLSVPMALVDESWSDLLKAQIARTRIAGLKLDLPLEDVGRALKAGKIEYSWKQLRAWLSPALASDVGSDQNEKLLTLPLKVIAPLFLAQQKNQKPGAAKKGGLADDIPDLFFSAIAPPAPAGSAAPTEASTPAPAAEPEPVLAPAAPREESFSTTRFIRKDGRGPADLGELFSQPGKTSWTPAEIVQNTARIKGVEGAIIAMHDGELVAAHLKSPWRPEATAAFIPQIFSRLEQYAKELDAGGLTHVMLTTEGGTLHVFNAGRIYFAVVGSAGQADTVQMAPVRMIVSELSKHSQ